MTTAASLLATLRAMPAPLPPRVAAAAARIDQAASETARVSVVPPADRTAIDLTPELRTAKACREGCEWCGRDLKPIQSEALAAIRDADGGLCPIGVGHGKTAIACLVGAVLEAKFVLVLTRKVLIPALEETFKMLRRHFRVVPILPMAYSQLSRPQSSSTLDRIAATYHPREIVIVADEAHALANADTATVRRFRRFFETCPARFVALSGTITQKSIADYAHLAEQALGRYSPVPRPSKGEAEVKAWCAVMDRDGKPGPKEWSTLGPFLGAWGEPVPGGGQYTLTGETRLAWARKALQSRLRDCPGVVCTQEGSLGASLTITELEGPEPGAEIADMLDALLRDGVDPRGDAMPSDDDLWRVGRHLSAGYYKKWIWPNGVKDLEWLQARSEWHRACRAELKARAREGYDSPLLVWNETKRRSEDGETSHLILAWRDWVKVKSRPAPPSVDTWVDTYLVEHAVEWARRYEATHKEPIIVWYESPAVGSAFALLGLPVYGADTRIPEAPPGKTIAASWRSHADGCNLQHAWRSSLIVEPTSSGKTIEQLIGRTHRQGQTADEVKVFAYTHTKPFRQAWASAKKGARYIEDSLGNAQKLNFATWIKGDDDG